MLPYVVGIVLIVVASYYVLFAAMAGSVETVTLESIVMTVFVTALAARDTAVTGVTA